MAPSRPDPGSTSAPARLVVVSGPLSGEVLPLTDGAIKIGRDPSNDICLSDLALSRAHCTIGTEDGTWRIRDCQSSNGTFVNGRRVETHQLLNGDRLKIGRVELTVEQVNH